MVNHDPVEAGHVPVGANDGAAATEGGCAAPVTADDGGRQSGWFTRF